MGMQIEKPLGDEMAEKVGVDVPTADKLAHLFTYHAPEGPDVVKYLDIRQMALVLAKTIDRCCPDGADKSAAIRKVREAVMTANAAIACCGKS